MSRAIMIEVYVHSAAFMVIMMGQYTIGSSC